MLKTKLRIKKTEPQDDFTITYKGKGGIIEIKTLKDEFLRSLRYFQDKRHEIDFVDDYYIHDKFSTEVFKDFIESIKSHEANINENNYTEYYELSCKYQYVELQETIEKFINERPDLLKVINQLSDTRSTDNNNDNDDQNQYDLTTSTKEEIIAQHLSVCLKNGYLNKLPNPVLLRIINSPKRNLDDHHLLYNLVIDRIRQAKNQNISDQNQEEVLRMLTSSLDYCEMSENEIEELLTLQEEFQLFQPRHSSERMKIFLAESKELKNKISHLEEMIGNVVSKLEENERKIATLKDQTTNRMNSIDENIGKKDTEQKNELKKISDKIEIIEKRINEKVDEQSSLIQNSQKSIQSIKSQIEDEKRNVSETRSEIQRVKETQNNHVASINKIGNDISNIKSEIGILHHSRECPQGIFKMLFEECNGNPVDKGIVVITGNSKDSNEQSLLPKIVDSQWKHNSWWSQDVENSYIKIEFKNSFVKIDKYRIRVGNSEGNCFFLSWTLEGVTKDGKNILISEVNNSNEIKRPQSEATVSVHSDSFVREIKLTMKGKRSDGYYVMIFRNIELYGTFIKT